MTYNPTQVLGLSIPDQYSAQVNDKASQLTNDQALSGALQALDQMIGLLTSSCYTEYCASSSFDGLAGGSDVWAEYNPGPARVIQEVVAWASASGSGGVTTIDIQVQGTVGGTTFTSIFGPLGGPANAAMRVALSSSAGNYGLAKSGQTLMTSGSNTLWPAGSLLKCVFTTAAGAVGGSAMKNIVTQVRWSPSGSWAGRTAAP